MCKPKIKRKDFQYGLQPLKYSSVFLGDNLSKYIKLFVMPSTSPRVSTHQKLDKLKFFQEIYNICYS